MAKSIDGTIADILAEHPLEFEIRSSDGSREKYSTYPKFQVQGHNSGTIDVSIWQDGNYWKDLLWTAECTTLQEEHNMYVYDVVVVDKESDEIVFDGRLVASTGEQAKMMALADIMRESAPTNEVIANYHFVVKQVGEGYSK